MSNPDPSEDPYTITKNITVDGQEFCWFEEMKAHSWCPQESANQGVSTGMLYYTGWSRKIETVKIGCIYIRGQIGSKISVCKIRLIILR